MVYLIDAVIDFCRELCVEMKEIKRARVHVSKGQNKNEKRAGTVNLLPQRGRKITT